MLADDRLPFSVHEAIVAGGQTMRFTYRWHSATVYCIAGNGTVEDVAARAIVELAPGCLYSVGVGDDHVVDPADASCGSP